jgi:hypothetical protein
MTLLSPVQDESVDGYVRSLSDAGFVTIQAITSKAEAALIREIIVNLFENQVGAMNGDLFDTVAPPGEDTVKRSLQLTNPAKYAPQLLETSFVQNATFLARKLFHTDCVLRSNYVIVKPAHIGIGTPWHQDEAYRDSRFVYQELTFWMALQDVDVDQGCMMFIPKSHKRRILTHESPNNDPRKHAIVCSGDFQEKQAVACPLPAGGCTIHDQRTLHCTRNNASSVDRYAYILIFGLDATPPSGGRLYPWLERKGIAALRAKPGWFFRSVAKMVNAICRGQLRSFADLRDAVSRGIKIIRGN